MKTHSILLIRQDIRQQEQTIKELKAEIRNMVFFNHPTFFSQYVAKANKLLNAQSTVRRKRMELETILKTQNTQVWT
jgi:hypothetical protein